MRIFLILLMFFVGKGAWASDTKDQSCSTLESGPRICIRKAHFDQDLCSALLRFSTRHGLNVDFFTRLIWQESRFDPNAVSPANAMGIAQFIASTAKIRGLSDPFNPAEALDESARYLSYLVDKFGNLGMAAVAYNGGEQRARNFIAKKGGIAHETRNYVEIITNATAEQWRDTQGFAPDLALNGEMAFMPACLKLAQDRTFTEFKPKVVPRKPWGVQLAGGRSLSKARSAYKRRAAKCVAVLRRDEPTIFYKPSKQRGIKGYYVARIGRDSRASANALCRKLQFSGCACAVYKN